MTLSWEVSCYSTQVATDNDSILVLYSFQLYYRHAIDLLN